MNFERQTPSVNELIDSIIEASAHSWEQLNGEDKGQLKDLLNATTATVLGWRARPLEFHRESVIAEVTGLAYRLANSLYDENQWETCETLAFHSYELASAVDWRERALGALKLALLAGSSIPRWDDLDRLRSRVRQRIRRLLGLQANFDRLPNGIDLNRLTDDVVWRIWDRLWSQQVDDDGKRTLLRKNLKFGWNYAFSHPNHPAKPVFRTLAREFLAGEVATRIATGEIEAEWIDLYENEVSNEIADWDQNSGDETLLKTLSDIAQQLESRLKNGIERWLEWWRPLKTLREGDREAIESFREAQQSLFEEDALQKSVELFRKAFDLAPSDLGVKEWYAYALILAADYTSAERLLQQIITARRQDFATITNLAGIYVRTQRYREAADLLCPQELFQRNLHRRPYVGAVLGLTLQLELHEEVAERIAQLETPEWLAVGLVSAINHQQAELRTKLLRRIIETAAIVVGRKGSDLSDPNDALVPIARLEKDFAYFQTEGLLQEGIVHFSARTDRYPWFWANWHYLGKLHEMCGNIQEARTAFLRKAESTANSKAPRKSKLDNWHYYLEFCFRNQLYDALRPGIEGAEDAGMPEAKLLRYRRAMSAFGGGTPMATGERTTQPMERLGNIEIEGDEFISPNATTGLIGFEFSEPYPIQTQWTVFPTNDWAGDLTVLPMSRQDSERKELAVLWVSHDGTLPSTIVLRAKDGSIEQAVKLYRTDRSYTPRDHQSAINLLDLYPDVQNRIRRHIGSHLPGEILVLSAPAGFGVAQVIAQISGEAEQVNITVVSMLAPEGAPSEERVTRWLQQLLMRCYPSLVHTIQSYQDAARVIESLRSGAANRAKQVIAISGFADGWNVNDEKECSAITAFLDILQKLTDLPDLIWILGAEELFALRRSIPHPFWRSMQTHRIPLLSEEQMEQLLSNWFNEHNGISEQAIAALQSLSGGVFELFISLMHESIKEVNTVQQQRILAANVIHAANYVSSASSLFRKWGELQLPSQNPARQILDKLVSGGQLPETDPDVVFLRELGLVVGRPSEAKVVTSLYESLLAVPSRDSDSADSGKSPAIVLVDHENLFLGLRDNAMKNGQNWNDRDPTLVKRIAERLLNWVQKNHNITGHPVAIANWDRDPFISHMRPTQHSGFYTLIPEGTKENSSDFMIYIECQRLLREFSQVETVILVTGDGDFASLVRSLQNQGKRVRVLAPNGTAALTLRAAVGTDFQFIEPILEG